MLFVAGVSAFLGVAVQRSSGIGFALVCAPIFSLAYGGYQGILLANALSAVTTFSVFISTRAGLDLRRLLLLGSGAIFGVLIGVLLTRSVPDALLTLLSGSVVILLVAGLLRNRKKQPPKEHPYNPYNPYNMRAGHSLTISTGALSGFLTAAAGVGGAPMVVYARRTNWPVESFLPTTQCLAFSTSLTAVGLKGLPGVPVADLGVISACCAVGFVFGAYGAGRLSSDLRMRIALYLSFAAGAVAFMVGVGEFV